MTYLEILQPQSSSVEVGHTGRFDAQDLGSQGPDIHRLCEDWVVWGRTRRLYGPKPTPGTILGRLSGCNARPLVSGGPDAICSAEMAAFHLAYVSQPDALDKRVFDLYYVHRVAPVKTAAAALNISRKHFYSVLSDFRKRLHMASQSILAENTEAGRAIARGN